MDFQAIDIALKIANTLGIVGVAIYTWWVNRDRATKDAIDAVKREATDAIASVRAAVDAEIEEMAKRTQTHAERITRIETAAHHAPNVGDVKRLHERIDEMVAGNARLAGEFHAANSTLQRIQDYLLNSKS